MTWRWVKLLFARKPKLNPDLAAFHNELIHSVYGRDHSGLDVAGDFRSLLLQADPALGKRVLFMIMSWCGEYEDPPTDGDLLREYAGRRRVANKIKAALYADLTNALDEELTTDDQLDD